MKNILIIEDETVAADHLQRTLLEVLPQAHVTATLQSIEETVEYFQHLSDTSIRNTMTEMPDLVFMDIHLADGLAFSIFDKVNIECPVIFTTAYDEYAIDAFRRGGFDYLLKPIATADLQRAISRLNHLLRHGAGGSISREGIHQIAGQLRSYRSHFLIPVRNKLVPVDVKNIACLYVEDKITHIIMADGSTVIVDKPLDTVMEQLDPQLFFRANRQYIVSHNAIREIVMWPISKLALTLSVKTPNAIIISKAKAPEFKQWYTK